MAGKIDGCSSQIMINSVERIVNMMQDTASFAGIEGGLQTTGFINEQKGI
jgi:hypothetical protein